MNFDLTDRDILEFFDLVQNKIKEKYRPSINREILIGKHNAQKEMYQELSSYEPYKLYLTRDQFIKALRFKQRRKRKRQKCNEITLELCDYGRFLNDMDINCQLVFGTCTFNDKALTRKEETNTKKVNQFIKRHCIRALVNIDYGELNERIHHHFLGITTENLIDTGHKSQKGHTLYNFENNDYELGFCDMEIIPKEIWFQSDLKKVSNYLAKMKFHTIKKSTKNRRIRYIKK